MKRQILQQLPDLERETELAIFKHATDDDGLKVKALIYTEEEDATDWRVVMGKMKRCCICETNERIVSAGVTNLLPKRLTTLLNN